jgi:cell wall-associated NlpC family hydrolase
VPYDEVPTITVTDSGTTTSGYGSQRAAKRAVRAQKKRAKRVARIIVKETKREPQTLPKAPPKYAPPKLTPIQKVEQQSAKAFNAEGGKQVPVPFAKQAKTIPANQAATAKISSVPGKNPNLKGTQPERKAARRNVQQARRVVARTRKATALPGLGPQESHVARKVLKTGEKRDANLKEQLAAAETGLVETGFKNLAGGDADSEGWRQERRQFYPNPTNVKASANRFYDEIASDTGGARGKGQTAGQLAQTVQASAYPERYDERKPEAKAIVKAFEKGKPDPEAVASYKSAVKEAKKLGLKVATGKGSPPPKKVVTRFKAARKAASQIEKLHLPYVWGGGHNSGPVQLGSGVDCSGAVSYVLQKMGVKLPGGVVSGDMGTYLKPGPGAVTVFYNPDHTFMKIGNEYFGTSGSNPGGGAGIIDSSIAGPESRSGAYSVGHVPGLGQKVALQLGIKGTQPFPGMTLSSSGTSATIDSGAGATVSKPGFSKQPIKLTQQQKTNRAKKKLKTLGVGESSTATPQTTLSSLEKKYGLVA